MAVGIRHALLRELKLRLTVYDIRVEQRNGPVSAQPVIEIAREVAANYAQARKEKNEAHAAYNRQVRAEREAQGLCRKCGKVPPRDGRKTCQICGASDVLSSRRQYDACRKKPKK